MESTTLYYRAGASDKVYRAELAPTQDGWLVHFAYGRRGSTFQTGTKTARPLPEAEARKIYDQLLASKKAKGYSAGADGIPYQDDAGQTLGLQPQLLNPVEEADIDRLLADDDFLLQPKLDGKRFLLRKQGDEVVGFNRRGLGCGTPHSLIHAALQLPGDFLVDGECIDGDLHVFDLLSREGCDLKPLPYKRRAEELLFLLASGIQHSLKWVPTFRGEALKREKLEFFRRQRQEGVVFKRAPALFAAGRPASGGDQLKFKFVNTASVVVSGLNQRRSVAISLIEDERLVPAGNVAIPPRTKIPPVGAVAEVRYLYAHRESGALFQPVYLGTREDVLISECLTSQLQFKAAA